MKKQMNGDTNTTMSDEGFTLPPDADAVSWETNAGRDAFKQLMLGVAFYNSNGKASTIKQAIEYFRNSAERDAAKAGTSIHAWQEAQQFLAVAYEHGIGVEKNKEEAEKWWAFTEKQMQKRCEETTMNEEYDEEFTLPPGAIGVVDRFGADPRACYDKTLSGNAPIKDNECLLEKLTTSEITKFLDEYNSTPETEVLVMDGFDDCIVGLIHNVEKFPILCYDKRQVINSLIVNFTEENSTDLPDFDAYTTAIEWFEFNMIGAWMGNGTPCFLTLDFDGY